MKAELMYSSRVPGKFMMRVAFLGVVLMTCVYLFVQLLNTAIRLF